jgi:hypothetical protein
MKYSFMNAIMTAWQQIVQLHKKDITMKLTHKITVQPPPYSDHNGKIIQSNQITADSIDLIFIDNPQNKTVSVQIFPFKLNISLWTNNEYISIGNWTKSQAEQKLEALLGNDPAKYIRSLYPKTLEENPNHPGTILSKMIKNVGIKITDTCSCKKHALEMNDRGNDWCEENINTIVGWLKDEANRRNLPFMDSIGKLVVNRAIKKSRKLLLNEPVPENDEDLDNL